ncbi:MAG: GTPase Era [Cyclobacteriaceae bacterium]|nr:GTPase Era [Cyclobacteriaceae bacterium]
MNQEIEHRAGFVSIVGRPNVGKSSLMNRLVGENLSIVTAKAQTTRHRIMGILNGERYQIVYSDTPGILEPKYELHKAMMTFVKVSLEDADVVLLVTELGESFDPVLFRPLTFVKVPLILLINKCDLGKIDKAKAQAEAWSKHLTIAHTLIVSAKTGQGVNQVLPSIIERMPLHPGFFPKDDLTNRSERFFASEIIREKIFLQYDQEIPYSCEVMIDAFKEEPNLLRISATIFVERDSQKGIVIGKGGSSLKEVGSKARIDLERFFDRKVFLETHVKVATDWRKQKDRLRAFGYVEGI